MFTLNVNAMAGTSNFDVIPKSSGATKQGKLMCGESQVTEKQLTFLFIFVWLTK